MRSDDDGFTLIELMVVTLVIGILLTVAVPTFLNAQRTAKARAATSNVRAALSSIKQAYTDAGTYSLSVAQLKTMEPSLRWLQSTPSEGPNEIEFSGLGERAVLAVRSQSGVCYVIFDDVSPAGGTFYGRADGAGQCGGELDPAGWPTFTPSTFDAGDLKASPQDAGW